MIIDVHCHYTLTRRLATDSTPRFSFEPTHDAAGNAQLDSFVSPRATRRISFQCYRRLAGLPLDLPPGDALDAELERFFDQHLLEPGPIDRYVLLAFDDYHDRAGVRPPPPERDDAFGADIYTSNSLVRARCRQRPDRFLFGASVHPYRRDAVSCVREVASAGACLLKWLPLHQNIDIQDERSIDVLRCCAAINLPLLVHYNEEFTLRTQHAELQSLTPMLDVLRQLRREGVMPTVIVAHAATPVTPIGIEASHFELIRALRGEFAEAPLFADISALTTWGKIRYLRSLAQQQDLHAKLIFGTDFPVPLGLPRLRRDLGRAYSAIANVRSWPQQVACICRHMGFGDIVFRRFATLLPEKAREFAGPIG